MRKLRPLFPIRVLASTGSCGRGPQPQGEQNGLRLAECPNDSSRRRWRELDQSRRQENPVDQSALRFAKHVDDLNLVTIRQVCPAERVEIRDCLGRVLRMI